jgi:AcrR family transcriptional regulator
VSPALDRQPSPEPRESTRNRILAVALELFGRNGFDRTTVRAIAARCGMSDAALYYHFSSKRAILDALWESPKIRRLSGTHPLPSTGEGIIRELVNESLDATAEQDYMSRLIATLVLEGDQTAVGFRRKASIAWRQAVLERLRDAGCEGDPTDNMEVFVAFLLGAIVEAQVRCGSTFPEVAQEPEFRTRLQDMALVALRFPV